MPPVASRRGRPMWSCFRSLHSVGVSSDERQLCRYPAPAPAHFSDGLEGRLGSSKPRSLEGPAARTWVLHPCVGSGWGDGALAAAKAAWVL